MLHRALYLLLQDPLDSLKDKWPMELKEPSGRFQMRYELNKKKVFFCGGPKKPTAILLKRFSNYKRFWEYKGRIVGV